MHPIAYGTIGYIGGLLSAAVPLSREFTAAVPFAVCALLAAAGAALGNRWGRFPNRIPVAALWFLAGGSAAALLVPAFQRASVPPHHLLRNLPRGRLTLVGHLSRPVERRRNGTGAGPRIYLEVERMRLRGVNVPARGGARLTLLGPLSTNLEVGDRIRVRGVRLRRPKRYLNPGGFDYREFLRLRNVHAIGFAFPQGLVRLARRERGWTRRWIYRMQRRMQAHLRSALPEREAGLLETMALGTREDLAPDIREAFRRAGAAHLLAISGLHVGFIALFFYSVLHAVFARLPATWYPLRPIVITPAKAASMALIPIVLIFTLLTGARVSTIRAAIMVVVYLVARILERKGGALHSIFLAALILLLWEPAFLWDTGFQLTFVAAAAIILAANRLPRPAPGTGPLTGEWWRVRSLQLAIIQVVVTLALVPLTAWHFLQVQIIGLVSNFFLIPIASVAVPLTFLVASFGAAAAAIAGSAGALAFFPLESLLGFLSILMENIARAAAAVPGGSLPLPPPDPLLIALFYAALVASLGGRKGIWRGLGKTSLALLLALIVMPAVRPGKPLRGRTVLLLPDAGRRDAFFLRLPDGRGFAFDLGGSRSRFDTWKHVLGPLLHRERERRWDVLVARARSPAAESAAHVLAGGLGLRKIAFPDSAKILSLRPSPSGEGRSPAILPSFRRVRATGSGKERGPIPLGGSGFLRVRSGGARWLLFLRSRRRGSAPADLPRGRFDLVRLPERMLRRGGVLQWLERAKPAIVVAAPGRVRWLPRAEWRIIRARQRAVGVYRPARSGMMRITVRNTESGPRTLVERYRKPGAWPNAALGRWEREILCTRRSCRPPG